MTVDFRELVDYFFQILWKICVMHMIVDMLMYGLVYTLYTQEPVHIHVHLQKSLFNMPNLSQTFDYLFRAKHD